MAGLPDRVDLIRWRDAHARAAELRARLDERTRHHDEAEAAEQRAAGAAAEAEHEAAEAEAALSAAEQAHGAAALAAGIRPGQPCPVCRQPVGALPHHDTPADL